MHMESDLVCRAQGAALAFSLLFITLGVGNAANFSQVNLQRQIVQFCHCGYFVLIMQINLKEKKGMC